MRTVCYRRFGGRWADRQLSPTPPFLLAEAEMNEGPLSTGQLRPVNGGIVGGDSQPCPCFRPLATLLQTLALLDWKP